MRLTKADKETFVSAVIKDLPQHDYKADMDKLIVEYMRSKMSPKLLAAVIEWGDRFEKSCVRLPGSCYWNRYCHTVTYDGQNHNDLENEAPELHKKLTKLDEQDIEQREKRAALETKIKGVINSVTTLKRAHELLPEFADYLPKERDPMGMDGTPMISNLVAELTKEGWPADKQPAEA